MPARLAMCVVLIASVSPALGEDEKASAPSESPPPESAPTAAPAPDAPTLKIADRPPLGWLSDPKTPPKNIFEALVGGKVMLDDRLRFEYADTTGKKPSYAVTNRLRLGYETKPFYGFSALAEFENVVTPDSDLYSVPQAHQGDPARTTVADPKGTEINQAYGRFNVDSVGSTGVSLDIKGGRQRILLDDERFIGNVGWRQFEQTFDAASLRTDFGVDRLSVFYAYVWGVQKVFGPDGPNPDSNSHLVNVSYGFMPEIRVVPFAYLLDFEDDDPTNSSDSFGVRVTGDLWKNADDAADVFADYEATYAHQFDAGENPVDYDADFFAGQFRVTKKALGEAFVGYQYLGTDDGAMGFRFPLGTNHKFQGYADNFLVTPNVGLQDLYVGVGADLPWGVKGAMTFHQFWSVKGGDNFGDEFDLVASKKINSIWSVLIKGAFYDGDSGQPDTARVWVQTEVKF